MNGAEILLKILPPWRAAVAGAVGPAYFDGFIQRNRPRIVQLLDDWYSNRQRRRAAGPASSLEAPPDEWTPAAREKANLEAMRLLVDAPTKLDDNQRRVLLRYSGWGGLSIEKHKDKFPADLEVDSFGLIHEYYTPTRIARAIAGALCDFLPALAGRDGTIRALEPAAGIGRIMLAIDGLNQATCPHPPIQWTAVELSKVPARMLPHLFPDAEIFLGSFEEWLHSQTTRERPIGGLEGTPRATGKIRLVVSNPPYGKRGLTAKWDQSPEYQERDAFAYFLRRGLDLLAPFGIGVFLIPAGFLTGISAPRRELRDRVLRRHHLMAAFRLPSEVFPGANLVTDLLFFRARGGELAAVDDADHFILEGRYFDEFPQHVLGEEVGRGGDEDDGAPRPKGRNRHSVRGEFRGLPPLIERPLCSACVVRPVNFAPAVASRLVRRINTDELLPLLATAVTLGHRVADYLAERSQGTRRAVELWPELLRSLRDFQRAPEVTELGVQNPWSWMDLRTLADQDVPGAQSFLNAFSKKTGELSPAILARPEVEETFRGDAGDLLAQADFLYRTRRRITIDDLYQFHRERGGTLSRPAMLDRLFRADWNLDGDGLREIMPLGEYVTGDLWQRIDALDAAANTGAFDRLQLSRQRDRLIAALGLVEFDDLSELSPADGYIPLDLLSDFASEVINGLASVPLERIKGLVQVVGEDYTTLTAASLKQETFHFIGWLNHDNTYFAPRTFHEADPEAANVKSIKFIAGDDLTVWDYRASHERAWILRFNDWVRADPERRAAVRDAYNRTHRRFVPRKYSGEPLEIARWGTDVTLAPHQNAAARRIQDARGGGLAFGVGVGKTYTGLGILALARQAGWGRRPVVLVPASLVWKWERDFRRCLPDYRVAVIGAKRTKLTRGPRHERASERRARGEINAEQFEQAITVSRADEGAERAAKWSAFQAGLYDAVILSYTALDRTALDLETINTYAEEAPAIQRVVSLQERNERRKKKPATERKKAVSEAGLKGFLADKIEASGKREFDPGVRWEDLGVDLLIVDEAQNFKNLHAPEPREGGIPKYMGLPPEGSKRAWQLEFRAASVRRRTGGSGVVLLSATPAKNSPLELYNLLQFIDQDAFTRLGIYDPEAFIDRYLKIETRDVLDTNFDITRKSAVVGFQHLDELRGVLDRLMEFRTAEEVGIKLPVPRVQRVDVEMDDAQNALYDEIVGVMTERLEQMLQGAQVNSSAVLGEMARLSLIALHSQLAEGYDWDTAIDGGLARRTIEITSVDTWMGRGWAVVSVDTEKGTAIVERDLPRPDPRSPKFQAVAERIAAQPDCGHIVFCEPLACHRWLVEILVENGIPRERIAVLNANADTNARITIADAFNGKPEEGIDPTYDVLIANSVANEGVDLQVRTCAIHHVDLPWTPADLEQRNGRAYRQGNTLGTIEIYYYISQGSMDGYRFSVIHGKRGWLTDLLESQNRDTNNPAAQQTFTPEELLEYIARDKTKVNKLLSARKEQQEREARERRAIAASALLRQAVGRFRDARRLKDTQPETAAKLYQGGNERLEELALVDAAVWPWGRWINVFREVDGLVPFGGTSPVFEGMRIVNDKGAVEFGQVRDSASGQRIGMRRAGEAAWALASSSEIEALEIRPEHIGAEWPDDDDQRVEVAMNAAISRLDSPRGLHWEGASEAFRERWWRRLGKAMTEALARRGAADDRLPILVRDNLILKAGAALRDGQLLAPTSAGWQIFLQKAPHSGEPWTALRDVGERWWGRKIPRDLLSSAKPQDDEDALSALQQQLKAAKEAHLITPTELVQWLYEAELSDAAALIEDHLADPSEPLEDLLKGVRNALIDELESRFSADLALDSEGHPDISLGQLLTDDEGQTYVLAYTLREPTRRVDIDQPVSTTAPYTIKRGELRKNDQIWNVRADSARLIEDVWRYYNGLARGLELTPVLLEQSRQLLETASDAIQGPKCTGDTRKQAIAALRNAKKQHDRARDRIVMGRTGSALEAIQRVITNLSQIAADLAQACEAGQQTLAMTDFVVPPDVNEVLGQDTDLAPSAP
jgi:superfamily II DNA or RNA helicase